MEPRIYGILTVQARHVRATPGRARRTIPRRMETQGDHIGEPLVEELEVRRAIPGGKSLILFDGVCNLCNGWVNFVIDRDPAERFIFGALQSDTAREYLTSADNRGALDSIVLINADGVFVRSSAVLRISGRLKGAWPLLTILRIVPRPLRDAVYDWIAQHRYSWFGFRETCRVPTPELSTRFL